MYFSIVALVAILPGVAVSTPVGSDSSTGMVAGPRTHNNGLYNIYGGHNITIDKAKYVAAILDSAQDLLGTAIILNNRWIVTAAWNFYQITEADVIVKYGSTVLAKDGKLVKIKKIYRHPKYTGYWFYDVALAKLETPLKFSGKVGTTTISSSPLPKNGAEGLVAGYGWTASSWGGFLKQVSAPVMDYKKCKPLYPESYFTPLSFCTAKENTGPCAYDFGSPLIYKNQVIGIFSGTYQCGSTTLPAAYAYASKFKKWIDETIKKNTEEDEILEYSEDNIDEE